MTDNVVEFPKRENMNIVVELDAEQENIETCLTSLICHINGLHVSADMTWIELMHASLLAAANCGMQAGLTAGEYKEILDSIEILKDEDKNG
jgi:hypothetical protein